MKKSSSLKNLLIRLWFHLNVRRRKQFVSLLFLMIFTSIIEIISIGSIVPFLAALTSQEKLSTKSVFFFFEFLGKDHFVVYITILFCSLSVFSALTRLALLTLSTKLSFASGADLSLYIYQKVLYQPYRVHVGMNSSETINGISNKTGSIISSVIFPLLTFISSSVLFISVLIALILIDPMISIIVTIIFGSLYALLTIKTRLKKIQNSGIIADQSSKRIKILQEGLGGIRDVIIDGSQSVFCNIYKNADTPFRRAQESNQIIAQSPRFLMEALGILIIAGLTLYLIESKGDISKAIPTIGLLALGAQRILPVMQNIYSSWSAIQGSYVSLQDILRLLDQPLPKYLDKLNPKPISFNRSIKLKKINFSYSSKRPKVIKDISLTIKKGDLIGIIGPTGSGKTTLTDILMGLLQPTSGVIQVDGKTISKLGLRSWQKHIAHVPQSTFLSDATIGENIAFGFQAEQIDWDKVRFAAKKAQLQDFILSLPDQYNAMVGERGVRLSGGQRQRISIARAFYKSADVLVFDEATSALDNQAEDAIMQSIEDLGDKVTVILIAHRLTTLRKCTKIIKVANGKIEAIGSYQDLIGSSR
jgi:ABC-type multidrug transport system fused ATPase/permease subunit